MGRCEMTHRKSNDTLYVTDLDGTLLDADSRVSERSVTLLNEAIDLGVDFTVATARTPATVAGLLREVNMKLPAIVMTGSAMWDFNSHKYSNLKFLQQSTALKLKEIYCEEGLPVFIYTLKDHKIEILHLGEFSTLEEKFISERAKTTFKHFAEPCCGKELAEPLDNVLLFYAMQPTADVERVYNRVKTIEDINPVYYHDIFGAETGILEVFSQTASKASAIKTLAAELGKTRIVAFGDNVNDLPMLNVATHSVAVGNAIEEVRNAADEVIGKNTENAVAEWILADVKSRLCNK